MQANTIERAILFTNAQMYRTFGWCFVDSVEGFETMIVQIEWNNPT